MMIKKAADRKDGSASGLVNYINRALDYIQRNNLKEDDRPVSWVDKCLSEDIELSKLEIESTQKMNTRSKVDKTYHMIISFSPEDKLTTELHKKLVAEVCEGLGFGEHQRVCAIHKDTDNEHCHVVINKIHPEKFTILEPYYDKFKMNDIAAALEQKYNLTVINHSNEKSENKVNHKIHYDGIKSFDQWVKENAKKPIEEIIKAGGTWQDVSDELAKFNLHVRENANGLVISDKDKPLYLKASSVSRNFKSLGPYDVNSITASFPSGSKKYERVPVTGDNELWTKYNEAKAVSSQEKETVKEVYKERAKQVYDEAKKQRNNTKMNKSLRGKFKMERYKVIHNAKLLRIAEINAEKKADLQKFNIGNWLEFLVREYNENGNVDALSQLQNSEVFNPKFKNKMVNTNKDDGYFSKVDKTGNSYEEVGKDKIFLVDDNLETQGESLELVTKLLDIAAEKYEGQLEVEGSAEFIKTIKIVAKIKGIEVNVAGEVDKASEKQERDISL